MTARRSPSVFLAAALVGPLPSLAGCAAEPEPEPEPPAIEVFERGDDQQRGNLLALQAHVGPHDYADEERLRARLATLFDEAAAKGMLSERTVVVLPEYIGAWLVVLDEDEGTYQEKSTADAMSHVALGHPLEWLGSLLSSPAEDGATHATFAVKAARMAGAYHDVMSGLAREHGVTLVAGSLLLPGPIVDEGRVGFTEGAPLANASYVFGADGALLGPPSVKVFPTGDEQAFLAPGAAADLPVFDTPAGRLGVLVCADAWFPAAYATLAAEGVDLVVVPQFTEGSGSWSAVWGGYSGHDAPDDVDMDDVGTLTEAEAWSKYALPGRLSEAGARAGLTAPLRGELWDLQSDGQSLLALPDGSAEAAPLYDGPMLINLWL